MPVVTPQDWEHFLASHSEAHLLQTRLWGELKAGFGWQVRYVITPGKVGQKAVGAQILLRKLPLGLSVAYIAKALSGLTAAQDETAAAFWSEVDGLCRRERAVFLKVEPDEWQLTPLGPNQTPPGFRLSPQSIQPARTLVVDLCGSEEQILGRMKQKTRYNIRLAEKKGVTVHASRDLDIFHQMLVVTGERDAFGVHSLEYYRRAYDLFHPAGLCEMLFAEYCGQPLAALMVFYRGQRAWYLYGASNNEQRERMPTYLLQWNALRWARERGCTSYDLWGTPDEDEEQLEAQFQHRQDGLWGVYRFKRGFGGQLKRNAGPWDRVYQPVFYALYRRWYRDRSEA